MRGHRSCNSRGARVCVLCSPPPRLAAQELQALITYIKMNKESDTDWFTIEPQDGGKAWKGKCW
jgi:hypothetical protein